MQQRTLQFYHDRHNDHGEQTIALEVPTKEELLNFRKLDMQIGIARVNPKDHYNKKIGREVSTERLAILPFKLKQVYFKDDNTSILTLISVAGDVALVRINENSNKPHFIMYYAVDPSNN